MKRSFIVLLFLISIHISAQAPVIQWQKCYGGTGTDIGTCIELTSDGGYIVAGYTASNNGDVTGNHGGNDCWIVKISSTGAIEWQKTYGGTFDDQLNSIRQTSDGGYIAAGVSNSTNGDITNSQGDKDMWILKLDATGNIQWQRKYGGDDAETAYSIQQTTDGGFIVAGKVYSYDGNVMPVNGDVVGFHGFIDGWILKLSNTGAIEWQNCLGTAAGEDVFLSIQQTTDGGYIAAGDATFYWMVKLSNTGAVDWNWQYSGDNYDSARDTIQTSDGGYIMVGDAVTHIFDNTGHNFGVIKTNSLGTQEWAYSFGGDGFFDIATKVVQTADNGYVISGITNSNWSGNVGPTNGMQDAWIIKLRSNGTLQWQKPMGGSATDSAADIKKTPDGGYIIAGATQSNNYNVSGNHGGVDFWVVKLGPDSTSLNIDQPSIATAYAYPNPVKDKINFSEKIVFASIYGIDGKCIQTTAVKGKDMDVSGLSQGCYILRLETENGIYSSKLIKE